MTSAASVVAKGRASLRSATAPVAAVSMAALAATGPVGVVIATTLLLSSAILFLDWAGTLAIFALRPAVDCFWNLRIFPGGDRLWNLQSVVGVLIPLTLLWNLLLRGRKIQWTDVGLWFALYLISCTIGTLLFTVGTQSGADLLRIALPFAFFLVAFEQSKRSESLLIPAFVLSTYAFLPAVTGLLQLCGILTPPEGAVTTGAHWVTRISGLYHHPYEIAMRCAVSIPFALMLGTHLPSRGGRRFMNLWAVGLVLIGFATLLRTTMVAITVELFAWFWMSGKRVLAGVLIGLPLLLLPLVGPVRTVILEAIRPLTSGAWYELGTGRAVLFAAQVSAFEQGSPLEKLVGRGLHSAPDITERFSPLEKISMGQSTFGEGNKGAHNQFLRVLDESGLVGLIAILGVMVCSVRVCLRGMKRNCDGEIDHDFARSTLTMLISFLVICLSFQPFDQPATTWPLWLALGLVAGRVAAVAPQSAIPSALEPATA
jgi:hypothetical protein